MTVDSPVGPLGRALRFFGSLKAMARALGVTSRDLWGAMDRGKVSGRVAERIDQLTSGMVRCEELRPDLFPRGRHFNRVRVRKRNEPRVRKR